MKKSIFIRLIIYVIIVLIYRVIYLITAFLKGFGSTSNNFREDIDTEQYNYLTINMPNFDLCFFAFEPYDHELVYVKKANQLIWAGKIWEK